MSARLDRLGLKPFQQATVRAALQTFAPDQPVRRFLVADEVGLGKTLVARGVIRALMDARPDKTRPLRVFYICSSLSIASQNRTSLLKVLGKDPRRDSAACQVDRLTLVPTLHSETGDNGHPDLRLYTLTPDTSIPDRQGRSRSGTAVERALLHNLLEKTSERLVVDPDGTHWLQRGATAHWGWYRSIPRATPSRWLQHAFRAELRRELKLAKGAHLAPAVRASRRFHGTRNHDRDLHTIGRLRVVLARTGLKMVAPDLVIFDEFQRFRDLLGTDAHPGASRIAQQLVATGPSGPAVLMLSATPYKLYGADWEQAFGDSSHHDQFFELIEWLAGGDAAATQRRQTLHAHFAAYAEGLRSAHPAGPSTIAAKGQIEALLRPHMARTERFSHAHGQAASREQTLPVIPLPIDIASFRHVATSFRGPDAAPTRQGYRSSAVPYWTSVPLAMQLLGPDYKPWAAAHRTVPDDPDLHLDQTRRDVFRGPSQWPHPRLRALSKTLPPAHMALPWVAPSSTWWPLSGAWADGGPTKVLIFSRFRAVPRAIASLLSYDVERHLLQGGRLRYPKVTEQPALVPSPAVLTAFHPCVALARAVQPTTLTALTPDGLVAQAAEQLRQWLGQRSIRVAVTATSDRPLPALVMALEWARDRPHSKKRPGGRGLTLAEAAWTALIQDVGDSTADSKRALNNVLSSWADSAPQPLAAISESELLRLARHALGGPGVMLARALSRHWGDALTTGLGTTLSACWRGLRSYLNNRWFEAALPGPTRYEDRITDAIIAGNLESAIDEQLWATGVLRSTSPAHLARELTRALSIRTSTARLHAPAAEDSFTLRGHAALPFTHAVSRFQPGGKVEESDRVRTDELRDAFNSPFWPHALASTSVGQEGLDFHTWCAAILHWDLPHSPVDLEQREGRVQRYAGLGVRQQLAKMDVASRLGPSSHTPSQSPWADRAARAEVAFAHDPMGLAPWWICDGAAVERRVFDLPYSEERRALERLQQQRLLYRLALGQPDQEDLIGALAGRLSPEQVRAVTVDLSGWGRERHPSSSPRDDNAG